MLFFMKTNLLRRITVITVIKTNLLFITEKS